MYFNNIQQLKKLHLSQKTTFKSKYSFYNNIIIYFCRKERVYTKLKYSRVPIYDSVSGGLACLFAGFLGFLISERFGYELVDSGDIYYFYMYIVLFCIACRIYIYSW